MKVAPRPSIRSWTSSSISCRVVKESHAGAAKVRKSGLEDHPQDPVGIPSLLKSLAKGAAVLGLAAALVSRLMHC
jgi:hypothetical protein